MRNYNIPTCYQSNGTSWTAEGGVICGCFDHLLFSSSNLHNTAQSAQHCELEKILVPPADRWKHHSWGGAIKIRGDTCSIRAGTFTNSGSNYPKLWEFQIILKTQRIIVFPGEYQVLSCVAV